MSWSDLENGQKVQAYIALTQLLFIVVYAIRTDENSGCTTPGFCFCFFLLLYLLLHAASYTLALLLKTLKKVHARIFQQQYIRTYWFICMSTLAKRLNLGERSAILYLLSTCVRVLAAGYK